MASVGGYEEGGDSRVDMVQIDGLVVLKIIKHCRENIPEAVTGHLLGLDVGSTLEVTNCFPFASRTDTFDEESADTGTEYQIEMMKNLRDVNVDSNTVGWYQSAYLGAFVNLSLIENQHAYQMNIRKCVVVVYDAVKTAQGTLALQAFRLTDKFMSLLQDQEFSPDAVTASGITHADIFEEIPIKIHNSGLINGLLHELDYQEVVPKPDFARLEMTSVSLLEKNIEFLVEVSDDLLSEQNKLQYHYRAVQRQQQQQAKWVQQRKQENAQRRRNGEAELPEKGDETDPMWKPIAPPSQLDTLVIQSQIQYLCDQTNQLAGASIHKHFMLNSVHKK